MSPDGLLPLAPSDEAFANDTRNELSDWLDMALLTLCVALATVELIVDTNVLNDCMYVALSAVV